MGTANNMFSDLIPQQQQAVGGQNMFADLIPQQTPSPQSGGYFSDISTNVGNRLSNVDNLIDQGRAGQINPLQAGLWGTGQLAGAANDTVGRTIQQIPGYKTLSNAFTGGAQNIADYLDSTKTGQAAGNIGLGAENAVTSWAQDHPATSNSISALMNIAGAAPTVGGAIKGGATILDKMGENSATSTKAATLGLSKYTGLEPKTKLPAELQAFEGMPGGTKAGLFSKTPNPLQTGLEANQKISQGFEANTALQRQAYDDLNKVGSSFSVPQQQLYDKLNSTIDYLQDKVGEGSQEHQALSELKDIRDDLIKKYSISGTPDKTIQMPSWKQPMTIKGDPGQSAYGIQPSDLVDIKTAINSGLNPNKFMTHGKSIILGLKSYVQQGLNEASTTVPEFGDALNKAESQAAKVAQYRNPALKALWQPEDYVAYKSGNATAPTMVNRAARFLDNMQSDTQATGRAFALSKVLEPDDLKGLIRNAVLHANRNKPTILGALASVIPNPLHPFDYIHSGFGIPGAITKAYGAMTGVEPSPLENLAAQLKAMQK